MTNMQRIKRRNPAYYLTFDKLLGYNVLEKYLNTPFEEELNNPKIQMAIIRHNLYEDLFYHIDILTDKQVVIEMLSNRVWQKTNLRIFEGSIQNIIISDNKYMDFELREKYSNKLYEIKGCAFNSLKYMEEYTNNIIGPYKDNIIVIAENCNDYYRLRCLMKSYRDIDIKEYHDKYQKHLNELSTIWNEDYSSIDNAPDNIIKVAEGNIKRYTNNDRARNYIVNGVMKVINNKQVIETITNDEIITLVEEYEERYNIIDKLKTRFIKYSEELGREQDNSVMLHFFDLVYERNLYKCSTYAELKQLIKYLYELQGGGKGEE